MSNWTRTADALPPWDTDVLGLWNPRILTHPTQVVRRVRGGWSVDGEWMPAPLFWMPLPDFSELIDREAA